jgi:DNA polymerase I-like protein with 3'-5' exonuclease and polymerase domains
MEEVPLNFQNIPRDDKTVKRAILPKRGALSEFDFSQIEPRIFGYYCMKGLGDDSIVRIYQEGRDVYREIAARTYSIPYDEITAQQRHRAGKIGFLATIYGAGPKALKEQIRISLAEAKDLYNSIHNGMPQIRLLSNPPPRSGYHPDYEPGMVERILKMRGYIKTPYGRHLHVEKYGGHKMLNKLIQGTAADLMKESLRKVDAYLDNTVVSLPLASRMVTSIHDSIGFDGPIEELQVLHDTIPDLMRSKWLTDVIPVEVDHEVSTTSWADMIDYEEWRGNQG